MNDYVHGYSEKEAKRLSDQAETLDNLLHHDSILPENIKVLEAGCGVGSQTKILASKNPSCQFTSIDISEKSIEQAEKIIQSLNIKNVKFQVADIFNLPFESGSFDHIFVCFVLEHLPDPVHALSALKGLLKKGGSITVIEGDHGSVFFYPDSKYARHNINCQVELQARKGGNANIGREVYPLLRKAGFSECTVSPRMVYADASKPGLVDGFTKKTFTAMIKGIKKDALLNSLAVEHEWDRGISDLCRTAESDGVFCYTFFKGNAVKP